MKGHPEEKVEPPKEPSKQRVQNVVTAFLNHPDDKEKRLAAIQKALELNEKERQSELHGSLTSADADQPLSSKRDSLKDNTQ